MSQSFDPAHEGFNQSPLNDLRLLSGPFWGELRVFLAVAKAKSFNKAGDALNMSQPTVSRQVKRLQDILGSQLLLSSKNGIVLTEKGLALAETLLALDEQLFSISHDLRGETREAEGLVRVSSTEALAGMFIVPSLTELRERYPKIQLHIRNPINLMSFRENQSDIVLSYAPNRTAGLETRQIGFVHLIPVATHHYFNRFGVPSRSNLEDHHFVDADYYASQNDTWGAWRAAISRGHVAHTCDNSFAYGFMVKAGLGIGLLSNFTLTDPDAVPLNLDIHVKLPLFLVAASERLQARPVRIIYDWLTDIFTARNPWFGPELNLDFSATATLSTTFSQVYDGTPFACAR